MCGRFERHSALSEFSKVVEGLMAEGIDPLPPSYNIAPSQAALVVRHETGTHRVDSLTWGLVPSWIKEPGKIRPINARAETIHQKPMFRDAFRYQRCLVLCDGYYEWKKLTNGRKQPYHLGRTDESPFVMAGLWSHNAHAASEGVETFCIITTPASGEAATIHHRMPVILPRAVQTQWLDPSVSKTEQVQELLLTGDTDLSVYPVSTFVNSPANNSVSCAMPFADSSVFS